MAREAIPGLGGITNRFGPRSLPEGKGGAVKTEGVLVQYELFITGADFATSTLDSVVIPAGFKPIRALVEVDVVGSMGGTTPHFCVGTSGSAATNGFDVSKAQAEATGVYEITSFNGTWAAQLTANTTIGLGLEGDSTITSAGEFKVIIEGYLA